MPCARLCLRGSWPWCAEIRIVDLSSFTHVMWWNNGVLSAAACQSLGTGRSHRDARPPPPALTSLAAWLVLPVFSTSLAGHAGVSPGNVSSRTLVAT